MQKEWWSLLLVVVVTCCGGNACGGGCAVGWCCGVVAGAAVCGCWCSCVMLAAASPSSMVPLPSSLDYSSSLTIFQLCIFISIFPWFRGVCLSVNNGPENVSQWNLKGALRALSALLGFGKMRRGGAAVAALQNKCLTDINWKFGTAVIFLGRRGCSCCIPGQGGTVVNCTAAFLTRGSLGGKEREKCRKYPWIQSIPCR